MNTDKLARTTFVLDRETHDQLSYVARRMGVSRSALIRDTIAEPVAMMHRWVSSVPDNMCPEDVERLLATMGDDLATFVSDKSEALGRIQ